MKRKVRKDVVQRDGRRRCGATSEREGRSDCATLVSGRESGDVVLKC